MALYRVLRSLETKSGIIRQGDFITSSSFPARSLEKLEASGAIGLLHAPPLSELPDFDGAEQLATIGIVSADQLLEADSDMIKTQSGIDAATLHAWQAEVSNWLIVPVRAASG
jgi:hypothetical protein